MINTVLIYGVSFDNIEKYKDEIKSWHPEIASETAEQINKFKGIDNYTWFMLFDKKSDKLYGVACIDINRYDNKIYLNMIWAEHGFGKIMTDKLYNFYNKQTPFRNGKKSFIFQAINDKVSTIYRSEYDDYNFVGKNEWGYDEFERYFV
jgi:hypothetical protein